MGTEESHHDERDFTFFLGGGREERKKLHLTLFPVGLHLLAVRAGGRVDGGEDEPEEEEDGEERRRRRRRHDAIWRRVPSSTGDGEEGGEKREPLDRGERKFWQLVEEEERERLFPLEVHGDKFWREGEKNVLQHPEVQRKWHRATQKKKKSTVRIPPQNH